MFAYEYQTYDQAEAALASAITDAEADGFAVDLVFYDLVVMVAEQTDTEAALEFCRTNLGFVPQPLTVRLGHPAWSAW